MLSQILLNRLSDNIAENNFSNGLKYSAKTFVKQLEEVERNRFDKFFEHNSEYSKQIYGAMDEFYEKVSKIEIQSIPVFNFIIDLLETNPKELEKSINELLIKIKQ